MRVAGGLEPLVNGQLAAAERLLASAVTVGDEQDHALWKASRDLWVRGTIDALEDDVPESALRTFTRAVGPPPGEGSVAEDLPVELEAIRDGMAVLLGIRSHATPARPAGPGAVDRRGPRLGP